MAKKTVALQEPVVRMTAEMGRSGLKHFGGMVHEEYDPDLRGQRGVKLYEEMRKNDPTIAMGLRLIKWVIGRVQWSVQPGGESKPDQEAAEFLDTCRNDMSQTWSKFLRDALTCLDFGFAWLEMVAKVRNGPEGNPPSRYDDGRLGWRKFTLLGHDSLAEWKFDETGGVQAFVQEAQYYGDHYAPQVTVPIEKSLLFRLDDEKNNPEGVSLLRATYDSYYKKKMVEEVECIGIERDLTGVLIINMPMSGTETDKEKAQQLLEQFKADDMAGFIAPQFGPEDHERWRFEIINSPGNKSIDTDKVIARYDQRIARAFLAQFLLLGQGDAGSWALSKDMSDVFEVALGAIIQNLEETINRFMVPPLFRLNDFGKLTALPEIKAGKVSRGDVEKFSTALKNLTDGGLLTPSAQLEQFIRQEMELPELTDEELERQEAVDQAPAETAPEAPDEETGTDEDALDQDGNEFAEGDPLALPDPDDDEAWAKIEEESNKRFKQTDRRMASELLRFARAYNYDKKVAELADLHSQKMGNFAARLRSGDLTFDRWVQFSKAQISAVMVDGYRIGVAQQQGILPSKIKLTPDQRRAALEQVKEQWKYFDGFAKDVKTQMTAGKKLTGAIETRAKMYGGAVKNSASSARVKGEGEQKLRWVRTKQDSCETCVGLAGQVKTAAEWEAGGILPGRNTRCRNNCGCSLVAVK